MHLIFAAILPSFCSAQPLQAAKSSRKGIWQIDRRSKRSGTAAYRGAAGWQPAQQQRLCKPRARISSSWVRHAALIHAAQKVILISSYAHRPDTAWDRADCHSISHFPDIASQWNAEGGCTVQGLGCWAATWAASGLTPSLVPKWSARPILRRIMIGGPSDTPQT